MRLVCTVVVVVAAVAHADFKRLFAERAAASSFLESNWNKYQENYHPTYVLDDDPSTAWVEGAEGDGLGESLTVRLSALKQAKALRLVITPGYQKSKALFAANGTPTRLGVTVHNAAGVVTGTTELSLQPKWGTQSFELPIDGGLATVTLTLREVRPGKTYKDSCVSDVQFFVDAEVPYDKRVEEAKRQAMLAWKKERLATARFFAALPATYPFVSSAYVVTREAPKVLSRRYSTVGDRGEGGAHSGVKDPAFVELDALIDAGKVPGDFDEAARADVKALRELVKDSKGGKWFTVSSKSVHRLPEGFAEPYTQTLMPALTPLLRAGDVTLFEAAKAELVIVPREAKSEQLGLRRDVALSTMKLLEGTPAAPRRAFVKHVEIVYERSDDEEGTWMLLTWGDDGLIRRISMWREERETSGGGRNMEPGVDPKLIPPEVTRLRRRSVEVWDFSVANGRIGAVRQRTVLSERGDPDDYTGISADEGIAVVLTSYEPKPKK